MTASCCVKQQGRAHNKGVLTLSEVAHNKRVVIIKVVTHNKRVLPYNRYNLSGPCSRVVYGDG